jgi:pyrroline-5-carboxylate reductase
MKLGLVGCGKMAQALLGRWLDSGAVQVQDVMGCTARSESARDVQATWGIRCGTDPGAVVRHSDVLVLGIKPQQFSDLWHVLAPEVRPGQIWLSLLAGVHTAQLEEALPGTRVVRCMPNTPVRVGLGLVGLAAGITADHGAMEVARRLCRVAGEVVEVPEADMDAFTAVAGCGPAYVFLFLEALASAAQQLGMTEEVSATMAAQVMAGALELARHDGRPPAVLRAEVTSRGGMTEAAIASLTDAGWPEAMTVAVHAAHARGKVLAQASVPVGNGRRRA